MSLNIAPQDVKQLREKTGAGIGDCKKALVEAAGDFSQAEKVLKKLGLASAAKRSARATSEGLVFLEKHNNGGSFAIVELRCETDFVAMTEQFTTLGTELCSMVLADKLTAPSEAMSAKVMEAGALLKENISIAKVYYMTIAANELLAEYRHDGGKIGVIIKLLIDKVELKEEPKLLELAHDLALHAAAYNPSFLDSSAVSQEFMGEQEEIFTSMAEKEQIPMKARSAYVKGKMGKVLSTHCFAEQGFVREDKKKVKKVISELASQLKIDIKMTDFKVVKVGASS